MDRVGQSSAQTAVSSPRASVATPPGNPADPGFSVDGQESGELDRLDASDESKGSEEADGPGEQQSVGYGPNAKSMAKVKGSRSGGSGQGAFSDNSDALIPDVDSSEPAKIGGPRQHSRDTRGTGKATGGRTIVVAVGRTALEESIRTLMVTQGGTVQHADQTVLLVSLQDKLKKRQLDSNMASINSRFKQEQANIQHTRKLQETSAKKMEEAREKLKNASIWQKIAVAFQWIASIVSIVVGSVLCATGAGTAVGALMIVGGLVGLVTAADGTMKAFSPGGLGIAGTAMVNTGRYSKEQARKGDEIFGYVTMAVAGVVLIVGVGSCIGSALASTTSTLVMAAATKIMVQAVKAMQAVVSVMSGGVGAGAGITQGMASRSQADAKEFEADGNTMQALYASITEQLERELDQVSRALKNNNDGLSAVLEAEQDKISSVVHAKI